jgi:hypothetical protein
LAFGCTHKTADDGAGPGGDDVATPSRTTDDAPAPPPDPIPPPTVAQPSGDGTPAKPAARVFFGVDETGALVRFSEDDPSKVETKTLVGLAPNERVIGIDYRPSNGKLYALGSSSRLYVVDEASGTAVAIGDKPFTPALSGESFGFDFDPASDGARVHSDVDQDMVLDPDLGTVAGVDPQLFFAEDDANAGQHVNVVGTAYTSGPLSSLFAIDSTRDLLLGLPDAYSGRARTIGALGVDTSEAAGFDITPEGTAYAALRTKDATGLYTIDLSTGAAKLVGNIGVTTGLHGLAIQPTK